MGASRLPELTRPPEQVRQLLSTQVERADQLIAGMDEDVETQVYELPGWGRDSWRDFQAWERRTLEILHRCFDQDGYARDFEQATKPPAGPVAWSAASPPPKPRPIDTANRIRSQIDSGKACIERTISNLDLMDAAEPQRDGEPYGSHIFVVHGRDTDRRTEVADFLRRSTGRDVTILDEKASGGRTLLEKLEAAAAQAGFAVVIATGDDVGMLSDDGEQLKPRMRQNVVFELGYFFGLLRRQRVVVLTDGDVEKPSDIDGLVYIALSGEWKIRLGRELVAASIPCDPLA